MLIYQTLTSNETCFWHYPSVDRGPDGSAGQPGGVGRGIGWGVEGDGQTRPLSAHTVCQSTGPSGKRETLTPRSFSLSPALVIRIDIHLEVHTLLLLNPFCFLCVCVLYLYNCFTLRYDHIIKYKGKGHNRFLLCKLKNNVKH